MLACAMITARLEKQAHELAENQNHSKIIKNFKITDAYFTRDQEMGERKRNCFQKSSEDPPPPKKNKKPREKIFQSHVRTHLHSQQIAGK